MIDYKSIGMIIGSLIGCMLAGILVYLETTIVIICLLLITFTLGGYLIGSEVDKIRI